MAQNPLPPPPPSGGVLDGWLYMLWRRLTQAGQILWSSIDFSGSNITDIATRDHADLQNLNTSSYSHLTATQVTDLTDGGSTTLHTHATGGGSGLGDFSTGLSTSVDSEIVLFSGTGGLTGKRASTTGILKGTSGVLSAATAGTDYVDKGTTSTLTAGFSCTPYNAGTKSSGTFTPDEANGNFQYCTNGGAHTLAPPTNNCTLIIQITNNGSAGAITTSGFTKVSGTAPTTTNGDDFFAFITKCNGFSHLSWQALQ
jgi:hypothetical protein